MGQLDQSDTTASQKQLVFRVSMGGVIAYHQADATPHTSGQSRYVLLAVQTCLIFYQYLIIVFAVIIVHILMPIIYGNNLKACSEGVKYSVHNFRRQDSATAAKGMTRRCGELITFEEMMTSRRTAKDKAAASDREKLSELVRTPWRLSSHSSKRGLIAAMTASPALGCDSRCCHSAMRSRTSAPTREKCGRAILKCGRTMLRHEWDSSNRVIPRPHKNNWCFGCPWTARLLTISSQYPSSGFCHCSEGDEAEMWRINCI
uniref:SFRICE_030479 n=1 Tax=Spodoptera frugiperda TaxID=7108 RepID=A0A2H1VQX5_SPOFR